MIAGPFLLGDRYRGLASADEASIQERAGSKTRLRQTRPSIGVRRSRSPGARRVAYILQAGTVISGSPSSALRSDLSSQITAQVTENVYGHATGGSLLIPQGARLIGSDDGQVSFGRSSSAGVDAGSSAEDGRSIVLEAPARSRCPAGRAGLEDGVDASLGALFKAALLSNHPGGRRELGSDTRTITLFARFAPRNRRHRKPMPDRSCGAVSSIQPADHLRPGYPVRVIVTTILCLIADGRRAMSSAETGRHPGRKPVKR